MSKSKVVRVRVEEKLQKRIDREASKRGMDRSSFIRHCIENELPNPKEVIIMTREEMIKEMVGENVVVNAEWIEENDPHLLDWITKSNYWGRGYDYNPERSEAIVELQFDEGGVRYYADFESSDSQDRWPSQNQEPWGEDEWEDWGDIEQLKKYYMLVKNND